MKKLIEVKNKMWGETSEGEYKKPKNNNVGLRGRNISHGVNAMRVHK